MESDEGNTSDASSAVREGGLCKYKKGKTLGEGKALK